MWKSRLKHSTAEFLSIQQFWLQLDIVSQQKTKENLECQHVGLRRRVQRPETRDSFFFFLGGEG